jgi:hypothetical protein
MHPFEHHGRSGVIAFLLIQPSVWVAAVLFAVLGWWWAAADLVTVSLIVGRLFGGDH